jgi:hypothetical protein
VTYVDPDFKTKRALKEAVARGEAVEVFEPGLGSVPWNGTVALEGPHYPKPHTWYARGEMRNGRLIRVK